MFRMAEYAQKSARLKEKVQEALLSAGVDFQVKDNKQNSIRLVFAGQYSAGKSSILKMLTGRNDIAIGAGITTQQTHIYDWNGIEVIDTPGIHTQLRPDHDEISYKAIASADMLVFVITNELFDSYMASHFRKLAIDKDKAGEMILVVNKMERTAKGNTSEQQNIIREDLKRILEPYTPEQLNLSFLDAESYLESIDERDDDPKLADELEARSGYLEFIKTLNRFVKEKSIPSKLTTELYIVDEQLEKAIKQLQPKSSDDDIGALEESFMQQRHFFIEAKGRMQQEVTDIYTNAASQIRDIGLDAANLLVEGCKQDEVEEALQNSVRQADNIIEKSQSEAIEVIEARLNEIGQQLDIIENSEFSKELKARLSGKFDGFPDGIKRVITNAGSEFQNAGKDILNKAYKAGAEGGLKLTNFSGSTIHQMVLKVGHGVNFKFKPWQAIKITKGIAIGGQVLNVLGVGLSAFMQIKVEQDEEKARKDLKTNRQNIRSQFNAAANELEDFARQYIKDNVNRPLETSIAIIDGNIQEIRDTRLNRSSNCRMLENLQKECRLLIQDIHSENNV
ncbi:MAG: 50S ribosome-binding GTPase [Lachnospiraceae bacterium]|nr:50S ribosome-binding GTPase [Lachnospiraceae bacterium]